MTNNGRITVKEVYELVNNRFDRMEDKFDRRMNLMEGRVDVLEDFRSWVIGGLAIIGLFVGGLTTWIWSKITK